MLIPFPCLHFSVRTGHAGKQGWSKQVTYTDNRVIIAPLRRRRIDVVHGYALSVPWIGEARDSIECQVLAESRHLNYKSEDWTRVQSTKSYSQSLKLIPCCLRDKCCQNSTHLLDGYVFLQPLDHIVDVFC